MTPERLVEIGEAIWKYGWQTRMAEALKTDVSTIRRWLAGHSRIPGPAETALEIMAQDPAKWGKRPAKKRRSRAP
jgi:hypothetical protein